MGKEKLFKFSTEKALQKAVSTKQVVPKGEKKFDIKQYSIHFNSIFTNASMFHAFYEHLKSEHNLEPLNFLVETDKCEVIDGSDKEKEQVQTVKHVVDTYVKTGAPFELNLSSDSKDKCLALLKDQLASPDKWVIAQQPSDVFDALKDVIIVELRLDVFPRFIRGPFCAAAAEENLNDNTIISLTKTVQYPYKDEDFIKQLVTDRDMAFCKALSQESWDWELVGSLTSQLNSFFSAHNYLPTVSFYQNASLGKFECIFPYSFEHVCCCCLPCSEVDIFDMNVTRIIDLGSVTHDELKKRIMERDPNDSINEKFGKRAASVIMFDARLPFPITTPRKYPVTTSIDYDPSTQTLTMLHKPCRHDSFAKETDNFNWKSKHKMPVFTSKTEKNPKIMDCYFMLDMQSYHIQKLDERRTSFKQVHLFDLEGWASSQYLQKVVAKDRGTTLRKTLLAHMKKKMNPNALTIESCKDSLLNDPIGRLLYNLDITGLDKEYEARKGTMKTDADEASTTLSTATTGTSTTNTVSIISEKNADVATAAIANPEQSQVPPPATNDAALQQIGQETASSQQQLKVVSAETLPHPVEPEQKQEQPVAEEQKVIPPPVEPEQKQEQSIVEEQKVTPPPVEPEQKQEQPVAEGQIPAAESEQKQESPNAELLHPIEPQQKQEPTSIIEHSTQESTDTVGIQ